MIRTSDIFDITKRYRKGFRLLNWYNRSFCDMQDDGGQSKVPFFEILGCRPSNYLYDNSIGLLYAMGHEGLISIGNTVPTISDVYFDTYTNILGGGGTFGTAFLSFAQRDFPNVNQNFSLFGMGSLESKPYISYSP